jgi:hypothetical protein
MGGMGGMLETNRGTMSRNDLVESLLLGVSLSRDERRALRGFVTREELVSEIARRVTTDGRFPFDHRGKGRMQLVMLGSGHVQLVTRRRSAATAETLASLEAAIEQYVDSEIGPSFGGVVVRSSGKRSP